MDYMNWKMNQNKDNEWDYEGKLTVPRRKRRNYALYKKLIELSKPLTPYQQLRDTIKNGEPITTMIMDDDEVTPKYMMAYDMIQFEKILDLIMELENKDES